MSDMLVWLVALPLSGAVATLVLPRRATTIVYATAVATTAAAGILLYGAGKPGTLSYELGGWAAGLGNPAF